MTNGDYCVPGNAVPTVKMTLGTQISGVPAGNDPCCSVVGSQYGMVDLHWYPIFERFPALKGMFGIDVLPVSKFPRLSAWVSAMQRLDCVKKVWISPKLHGRFFAGYRSGNVEYDVEMDEDTIAMQSA